MPRYAIIGVEGPHDLAFITKLLHGRGLKLYDGSFSKLDPFWNPFVPTYPKGGQLYVRMDMPAIVSNPDISVAIYSGTGSSLRTKFPATFVANPQFTTAISAFGIIADADDKTPANVAAEYATAFQPHFSKFPTVPGNIDQSAIRTGIFVLPDNAVQGTLENILLECAEQVYPNLKAGAEKFLTGIDRAPLDADDLDEIEAPAGLNKARVGCIVNVLKPGKTSQTSIQDNRWLHGNTLQLPSVERVTQFLRTLLSI